MSRPIESKDNYGLLFCKDRFVFFVNVSYKIWIYMEATQPDFKLHNHHDKLICFIGV